jgi:hypothetical protein
MMQALDPALLCVMASLRDYANVLSWSQVSGRLGPHTAGGDVLRATFTPEALLAAGLCCRLALVHPAFACVPDAATSELKFHVAVLPAL